MTSSNLEDNLRRVPPQNLEAESSVLGGILLENEAINRVLEVLTPDDFYRESHRRIFLAMIDLYNRKEPIDLITLSDFLKVKGDLEVVGGSNYLASLASTIPTSANIQYHASIVREKAQRRWLISVLTQACGDLYEDTCEDSLAITARLCTTLSSLQNGVPKGFVHVGDVVDKTVKQIEQAYERQDPVTGIPTGLADFDNRVGGIHRGTLTVIAGRPSMGKTAIGVTIAKNAAEKGYGVAFVSAESPAPRIVQRILAGASGIENRDLMRGKLTDEEFIELTRQATRVTNLPLWLLDSDRSWDRIKAKVRALKLKEPNLALVILDYVGLLSAQLHGERRLERYLEIGRISSEAKGLAIDLDLGILLLSQLNREVEGRTDKKPKLSDLRESGNLEQDGDLIGLLYREIYYNENARYKDLAELEIAKNRDGCTGIIKLRFQEETVSFSDWLEPPLERDFSEARDG